jgi:hypothetical protein
MEPSYSMAPAGTPLREGAMANPPLYGQSFGWVPYVRHPPDAKGRDTQILLSEAIKSNVARHQS